MTKKLRKAIARKFNVRDIKQIGVEVFGIDGKKLVYLGSVREVAELCC